MLRFHGFLYGVILGLGLGGCAAAVPSSNGDGMAGPGSAETSKPAYDPFAGEMPDAMADALVLQLDGRPLEAEMQRALYAYGQQHPW